MKPAFISGLLFLILGAALSMASLVLLPHCRGDAVMRCVWMTRAVSCLAFGVAVEGVILQFVSRGPAMGLEISIVLLGLLIAATAGVVIGPCPSPMMACHKLTQGVIIVSGLVISVAALADLWRLSRSRAS